MIEILSNYLSSIIVIIGIGFILWLVSLWIEDASIIDFYWGPGFVLVAHLSAFNLGYFNLAISQWLLLILISFWGIRLGWHMISKHHKNGEEDIRYKRMRQKFSPGYWWKSGLIIFALQSVLILIISIPYHLSLGGSNILFYEIWGNLLIIIGAISAILGLIYEIVADYQLASFKRNDIAKNDVLMSGLWQYSRHPNYLGEIIFSWGIGLICVSHIGLIGFLSPLIITFVILKVSGVPLAERTMLDSRREKYQDYQKKTPAVFPKFW